MSYSSVNKNTKPKNYLPDSIYALCGEEDKPPCNICSNVVWSPVVNGYVHDSQNGKVFCPFGKGNSMNKSIFEDQTYLLQTNKQADTTWGRVPQLQPRSLIKVGLEWRTS